MAIIVTFGEVRFRYSRFPKRQNVQENAKFQHEYSLMAETEIFGGSGAPGFRNGKCLQFRYHWKVKMVRAGYLTLVRDIWEANLGNMNLVKPLLNRSHYFTFRYWIWLLKWLL
ncbi:unnamed protein product [Rhizophagus irregularis]|nr:unnamed protein product [Rhizophagus irregularis]